MAHGLVKGIDRMATTSLETIWHRAETEGDGRLIEVEPIPNDNEGTIIAMGAKVWPVDADNDVAGTKPIYCEGIEVKSHIATVSPSGRILGIVTKGYQTIEFRGSVFNEWLLALARAGGKPETLGTFDGGRNMFATLQVADSWQVPGDHSETRSLFNIIANNTGESANKASMATFRVVCANTSAAYSSAHEAMGKDGASRAKNAWVSIRHTTNAKERMQDAVGWITDGRKRAETERAMLDRMAMQLIDRKQVEDFVASYINIPADLKGRALAIRENQRESFQATMQDLKDLGNHALGSAGISAYGLLQAVTRYEDWVSSCRSKDVPVGTRRAFRAFLGERETEKATARDQILEMAGITR